jgi:chromosome partitioning protein
MVISIASQKGGTGKTTTSLTLASGLGLAGKRVLLVDLDSQANSSKVAHPDYQSVKSEDTLFATILHRKPLSRVPSRFANVDVVPSHILLSETDLHLTTAKDHREARLKKQLDVMKDEYDYVLIDCPPSLGWLTLNAFTASDSVLVVVSPGYFELDSLVQIGKVLEEVRELFNPSLGFLGFLFTMSDPTVNSKTSLKILRQTYTDQVLKSVVPRNTDMRDAHMNKQSIFDYAPQSSSAHAYKKLLEELQL